MDPFTNNFSVYGVLGKSCLLGAMLSRVPGWEGEASPSTAKACSPRGEDMLSRWDLKVACPRKAAAKAWHPADMTFPGCYSQKPRASAEPTKGFSPRSHGNNPGCG